MLPASALRSMSVMIATPCYGGAAQSNFLNKIAGIAAECAKLGLISQFRTYADSLVTNARITLVAEFLSDPSLTHLVFIDADVGFEPDAFFRLLRADRDVVAGVYPRKEFNWPAGGLPKAMTQEEFEARYTTYPFGTLPHGRLDVDRNGFAEVSAAPAGFMCIKRSVFEKMQGAYPELGYSPAAARPGTKPGTYWLFFDTLHADGQYLSEDFAFCRRWREIGGQVYIDANSKLTHQGSHTWQGNLKAHLEAIRLP